MCVGHFYYSNFNAHLCLGSFLSVISTHSTSTVKSGVTNVIVVVHGSNADAVETYEDARSALGNRTDTLIIAPWFTTEPIFGTDWDMRCTATASVYWPLNGVPAWLKGGDHAITGRVKGRTGISSFELLDRLYRDLQSRAVFPFVAHRLVCGLF